jgi:tRNA A37 N6-isopentenylltransferase MiaA
VEAGLAIAELIASMKKPTVSLVLGGGHSIGVPLAVSAKRSFIVPSATMTVHPVRISGTLIGAPQTYRYFSRMQNRITDFVVAHSKITKEQFNGLLMRTEEMATDVGSILEGKEAVEAGLIDEVKKLTGMGLTAEDISMKGIGYKEIIEYLDGETSLEEAVDKIKKNTRHYAKRQLTWFRRYDRIHLFDLSAYLTDQEAKRGFISWLEKKL